MTLGTPEQDKAFHTVLDPHPCHYGAPWSGTAPAFTALHPTRHCPALAAPIYSLGVQQGAFHRDQAQRGGFCFKKEKKEQETNALFVRFLRSYCCNSQQL